MNNERSSMILFSRRSLNMAKSDVLQLLYSKRKSPLEFNFDMLTAPPLLSLITTEDIIQLNRIARSVKLSGKIDEKYKLIDRIMNNRGFIKLHAGTNRVVYRFIEDQRFVIKVAVDRVGMNDNPAEFKNQFLLKPFVTKVFEVSPCGTVGLFERVDAIMSREEFLSVADDIFNLITKVFVGKYILEDFGTHYFMNWGIRRNGMGLVLLDFPYVYELDGNKLYCNAPRIPGRKDLPCGGQLDYDDGFNNLVCTKCGKHYQARDLKKSEENKLIIVGGKKKMEIEIVVGNEVIFDSSKNKSAKVIDPEPEKQLIVDKIDDVVPDKVENKNNSDVEQKVQLSSKYGIFNKVTEEENISKNEEKEVLTSDDKITTEDNSSFDSMNDELDYALNSSEYSDDEDDEYEYNYDKYLSNRQRKDIRSSKKSHKKGNMDYSDF